MSADTVARLKITLDVVKPTVLRRIEVPFDIRLDRLHLTIQAALGWTNSHLYEIRAGDVGWSTLYPEADWPEDFLDARKARLDKVIEDVGTKRLRYIYDFGDGWEHEVVVEKVLTADSEKKCAVCLDGKRNASFDPVSLLLKFLSPSRTTLRAL